MNLTSEQRACVNASLDGQDLVVSASAGSGKSTVLFNIGAAHIARIPECRVLILLYNKDLQVDSVAKIARSFPECSQNMRTFTLNAFAMKVGRGSDYTAQGLVNAAEYLSGGGELTPDLVYDIVMVDESQDITPPIWQFLGTYIKAVEAARGSPVHLVFVGDHRQSVYEYAGADRRFMTCIDTLLARPFRRMALTVTFRMPASHVALANLLIGGTEMKSARPPGSPYMKPKYIICNVFDKTPSNAAYSQIRGWIDSGVALDEILVLAPSVHSNINERSLNINPLKTLQILLTADGIHIYVQSNDDQDGRDSSGRESLGKIVFQSMHASKGRERPYVLVMGFDSYHYDRFSRGSSTCHAIMPMFFVAITRSLQIDENRGGRMTIVHHYERDFVEPVLRAGLSDFMRLVDVRGMDMLNAMPPPLASSRGEAPVQVTRAVKRLDVIAINRVLGAFVANAKCTTHEPLSCALGPVNTMASLVDASTEDLSDINGAACEIFAQFAAAAAVPSLRRALVETHYARLRRVWRVNCNEPGMLDFLRPNMNRLYLWLQTLDDSSEPVSTDDMLLLAIVETLGTNQYTNRVRQLKYPSRNWRARYQWISEHEREHVERMFERSLLRMFPNADWASLNFGRSVGSARHKSRFAGELDMSFGGGEGGIVEIKAVGELDSFHKMQLVVYAAEAARTPGTTIPEGTVMALVNVRDGSAWTFEFAKDTVEAACVQLTQELLNADNPEFLGDDAFVRAHTHAPAS